MCRVAFCGGLCLMLLALCVSPAVCEESERTPERLEKQFAELLSGATLVGRYSIDGRDRDNGTDRYEIASAEKLKDDLWVITSRIKYGDNDVKIPMTLKVVWAGDTPVISLTDLTIPGLGTFTARVMFYGDRYAGTWQHGKVGGHMWGKVESPSEEESGETEKESP